MKKSAKVRSASGSGKSAVSSSIFGMIIGLCSLITLFVVFSALCMMFPNPHPFVLPLCFFSVYAASFFTGFAAVKRNGGGALLCGSLSGALFMILIWAIFALLGGILGSENIGVTSFIVKLLVLPISVIGGFLGLGTKSSVHKKHRRKF